MIKEKSGKKNLVDVCGLCTSADSKWLDRVKAFLLLVVVRSKLSLFLREMFWEEVGRYDADRSRQ